MLTDRSKQNQFNAIATDVPSNQIIEVNLSFSINKKNESIKDGSDWIKSQTQNLQYNSNKTFFIEDTREHPLMTNYLLRLKETEFPNIRILTSTNLTNFFQTSLNKLDKKYYITGEAIFPSSNNYLTTAINLNTEYSGGLVYYEKDKAINVSRSQSIRSHKCLEYKVFYPIFEIINNKKTKLILPENLNSLVTLSSNFIEHDYDVIVKYGLYRNKYINTAFNFWKNYNFSSSAKDMAITATATIAAATVYKLIN